MPRCSCRKIYAIDKWMVTVKLGGHVDCTKWAALLSIRLVKIEWRRISHHWQIGSERGVVMVSVSIS